MGSCCRGKETQGEFFAYGKMKPRGGVFSARNLY